MPTIRQLLDRHGRPPRDVALDWAWQIRQQLSDKQPSDESCLLVADKWTDLEVAADGQLLCEQLDERSARSALEDLQAWTVEAQSSSAKSACSESNEEEVRTAWEGRPTEVLACRLPRHRRGRTFNSRTGWIVGGIGGLLGMCVLVMYWSSPPASVPAQHPPAATTDSLVAELANNTVIESIDSSKFELDTSLVDQPVLDDGLVQPPSLAAIGQLSLAPSLDLNNPATPQPDVGQANSTEGDTSVVDASAVDMASGQADAKTSQELLASGSDTMREVQQAMQKAEAAEAVALINGNPAETHDAQGKPWVLMRDTLRYRVTVSPKLNLTRQSQWTLALEPIAGLAIEPQGPVSLSSQGAGIWRIYDAEAKPPRACLFVRALHRGREGTLDLVFCGGAEDMPTVSVPLADRWLGPLTASLQGQAVQLKATLARLSTTVITPEQAPIVLQRKQAMIAQLISSTRLIAVMPDINRLAELADGQVTLHAELRAKPDEPAVAAWGRISK